MRVFLGSSSESVDQMHEVASWLETTGLEVVPWDEPRLFQLGENTLEALVRISKSVDAAVFIFGEDDRIWYRSDALPQPRDNVLMEYGLFVGVLGPKRAIIARCGNPKTAADLQGITWVDVSPGKTNRAQLVLKAWAQNLGRANEDPALTELLLQRTILQNQLELANEQLRFAESTVSDLKTFVQTQGYIDFGSLSPDANGHWKLLFDRSYFQGAAIILETQFRVPNDIHILLSASGLKSISTSVSFQGNNSEYLLTAVTKLLRRFRGYESPERFKQFIDHVPTSAKAEIDTLARERAEVAATRSS